MRRSASSRATARSAGCGRERAHFERGSAPAMYTRLPRTSSVTPSSESSRAGERSRRNVRSTNGSRLIARSWLPRIAYARGSRGSSRRSVSSPDARVSTSPLTSVRSGCRASTHSTARLDRVRRPARHAEVEVREVRDPQPVELGRQARQRDVARLEPHPSRLEPRPAERGRRDCRERLQACSFSSDRARPTRRAA